MNTQENFADLFQNDFALIRKETGKFKAIAAKEFLVYGHQDKELKRRLADNISELAVQLGGDTFLSDGMLLWARELGWMNDKKFIDALSRAKPRKDELQICWRTHVLCWAAMQAKQASGDFFEFGCFQGFSGSVIRQYCRSIFEDNSKRDYWWFDLFVDSKTEKTRKLDHSHSEEIARDRASSFGDVRIIKGNVIETYLMMPEYNSKRVAFAHFDLNNFDIEYRILDQVMKKVDSRSVLIFDDFGMCPFRKQPRNYRKYFEEIAVPLLELPTGQGVVIIP